MKKYISIIIFVIIYSSCFSQQNLPIAFRREISYQGERAFFNGSPFTGLLVDKNTNNKLGEFKNGYKNGVFTKYYTNGRKKSVGKYVNGIKEGAFTGWFENGVKQIVLNYVHGALDGIYTQWFNNGQIMVTYNYTQGEVKDGKYIIYNDTGQKAKQETYAGGAMISSDIFRNGALYKSILEKYPDGTKKEEGYTKDGLNAGLWTEWYENGQKSKEGKYEDGKKVGVWTWWYNNGGKKKEVLYEMGQEVKLIYENNLDPALSINAKRKPGSYVYRIIDGVDEDTAYVMVVMNFDVMTIQNVPNRKLTSFIHDLIASFTEFRFQKMSYSDISINEDKPLSYCIEFSKLKWGIKRTNSTKVKGQYWFTGAINLDMKISNLISDSVVFNETLESYHNIFYSYEYTSTLAVFKSLPYELSGQIITNIYRAFKLKARMGKIIEISRKGAAKEVSVFDDLLSSWKGFCFLVYTKADTNNSIAKIEKVNKRNDDHRYKVIDGGDILAKYMKQGKPLVAISCYRF